MTQAKMDELKIFKGDTVLLKGKSFTYKKMALFLDRVDNLSYIL